MDFDLFSCTFENLNSLKFNELQKLSSHYRVNKRWAKKREIIEKLLLLRDEEMQKKNVIPDNVEKNLSQEENEQWIDANKVFSSAAVDMGPDSNETDRRLTYNVSHPNEEIVDRRLTFNVVKNEERQITRDVNLEISDNIDRRLTYNADEMKGIQRYLKNIKEACNPERKVEKDQILIPVKEFTTDETKDRSVKEDFSPQEKQLENSEKSNVNNKEMHIDKKEDGKGTCPNQTEKSTTLRSAKTKMLTIPYSRIPAQRKSAVKEPKICDTAGIKLNEKIPAACRSVKTRLDMSKTPHALQKQNTQFCNKVTGTIKTLVEQNNAASISKSNLCNTSVKTELSTLETKRKIIPRRKSKTEDNVLVTSLKTSRNLKFFSPPESRMENHKRLSEQNSLHLDINLKSKIPKAKALVEPQRPLTAKKMPDFSKIHQRQFEQMDSILDYKRKKEERAKKLFGVPQPGIPVKIKENMSLPIFQFKSTHNEKENKLDKTTETMKKPVQSVIRQPKEKPNRQDLISRAGSKSNIVKNVKEQTRKHLNGIRTNKRFELQMKFRKT